MKGQPEIEKAMLDAMVKFSVINVVKQ